LIRLVRSVLRGPIPEDLDDLAATIERAGRIQNPVAVKRLLANAFSVLSEWRDQPFARRFAEAPSIREDVAWSVQAGDRPILGRTDLIASIGDGKSILVHLAGPRDDLSRHRLRALLAMRESESLGFGAGSESWIVRLGGPLVIERVTDVTDPDLERAMLPLESRPSEFPGAMPMRSISMNAPTSD
jgi:hypothetical protein